MIVSELIEWLHSMPQNAKVQTLEHTGSGGYYQQGGTCRIVDFTDKIDYQQWKDEGDTTPPAYIYGEHFELTLIGEELFLQFGVKDK
jgi:hypothetical protein